MRSRIGAYGRISLDSEGEALGVTRQHQDNRKLADLRGWEITDTYTDNNVSAYKRDVVRPEFERLLEDLEAKRIDGFVAYDLDRIARQPSDLERVIRIYEERKGMVFATVQGDIDLSGNGVTMARVLVAFANKSSKDTSRRVKRKIQELAENGEPHWGRLPFGYNRDGTLNPLEAPTVRDMGMWFLKGFSYREIAWRLNESARFTRAGSPWYVGTIRQFMSAERFAAIRRHESVEYKGSWEAIFTRDEWASIQYEVKARKSKYRGRPQSKKYLLTGLVTCGGDACGAFLRGMTKRDNPGTPLRRTYQCAVSSETERRTKTCGGMCVGADPLGHFIREAICYRLDTVELGELLASADGDDSTLRDLLAEADRLMSRKNALVDDYADGTLSKADYSRARTRVETQLVDIDKQMNALRQKRLNVTLDPGQTVRDAWMTNPDGWRRELIDVLISDITIEKSRKNPYYEFDGKRTRFDPSRVNIAWRV